MSRQLTLPLAGTSRRGRIGLSTADRNLIASTSVNKLPDSLLIEMRAQRMGCSAGELRAMRSYELARELAEERAFVGLGDVDGRINSYRPDWELLDAIAKRETADRMRDFQEWLSKR